MNNIMRRMMLICIISSISIIANTSGKAAEIKIISSNSKAMIKKQESGKPCKSMAGTCISAKDKIIVKENGYIALVCGNGKPFEIRNPGEFEASVLIENCEKITSGAFRNFADWLVNNMIKEKSDKGTMMKSLGAVSRMSSGSKKVNIPVRRSKVIDSNFALIWNSTRVSLGSPNGMYEVNDTKYKVSLFDAGGKEVFSKECKDTVCIVDMKLNNYYHYPLYWLVEAKGYPRTVSDTAMIIVVPVNEAEEIENHAREARLEFDSPDSPLYNIVMADYFEGKGLMFESYKSYLKAINFKEPPEEFLDSYSEFCNRAKK